MISLQVAADTDRLVATDEKTRSPQGIRTFSTCPESRDVDLRTYREVVRTAAAASEDLGCTGMLIYAENRLVDPWLVAQIVIEATERLVPLVAVQPAYSHPYTVAKLLSTLTNLYERQIDLNLVAGGFRNDLLALGDQSEHDDRYHRLREFGQIVAGLCRGDAVTMDGRFYAVTGLRLTPSLPPALQPAFMVSGSSTAGREVATTLHATAVRYPLPPGEEDGSRDRDRSGIRIGIIARADSEEAWQVAHDTFPPDRGGEIAFGFAMKASDSHWHHRLSSARVETPGTGSPYWLHPFRRYQTFCPYLVGSYSEVAAEIRRYVAHGADTVILDIPRREQELAHCLRSLRLATS